MKLLRQKNKTLIIMNNHTYYYIAIMLFLLLAHTINYNYSFIVYCIGMFIAFLLFMSKFVNKQY